MPISTDEHVKDVVYYKDNILHIHCKTRDPAPYNFIVCIDNSIFPFSTLYFLKSLNNLIYDPLMKDVEQDFDWNL